MINTNVMPFNFNDQDIRIVLDENGEALFVAKDITKALDYTWNGSSRISHVPEELRQLMYLMRITRLLKLITSSLTIEQVKPLSEHIRGSIIKFQAMIRVEVLS